MVVLPTKSDEITFRSLRVCEISNKYVTLAENG